LENIFTFIDASNKYEIQHATFNSFFSYVCEAIGWRLFWHLICTLFYQTKHKFLIKGLSKIRTFYESEGEHVVATEEKKPYEPPELITCAEAELQEKIGPVQTCNAFNGAVIGC
jgi:hypothetical protein